MTKTRIIRPKRSYSKRAACVRIASVQRGHFILHVYFDFLVFKLCCDFRNSTKSSFMNIIVTHVTSNISLWVFLKAASRDITVDNLCSIKNTDVRQVLQ